MKKMECQAAPATRNQLPLAKPRRPRLSAESWFIDHTFISKEWADYIWDQCRADGALAIIEHHPKCGWVFHTLCRQGVITTKEIAKEFAHDSRRALTERQMEDALCNDLRARGVAFGRQVPCNIGIADVLTDSTVYELKHSVHGSAMFAAVGQAIAYRAAFGVANAAVVTDGPDRRAKNIGVLVGVRVLDCEEAIAKGLIQ